MKPQACFLLLSFFFGGLFPSFSDRVFCLFSYAVRKIKPSTVRLRGRNGGPILSGLLCDPFFPFEGNKSLSFFSMPGILSLVPRIPSFVFLPFSSDLVASLVFFSFAFFLTAAERQRSASRTRSKTEVLPSDCITVFTSALHGDERSKAEWRIRSPDSSRSSAAGSFVRSTRPPHHRFHRVSTEFCAILPKKDFL